jgi:hypothetical protein
VDRHRLSGLALAALGGLAAAGCSGIENPKRQQSTRANIAANVEVPPILEGTISAAAVLEGFQPVIVHGYGIVVGLDGTGASDVPPEVRAHMIAMAGRHGIGSPSAGMSSISPETLIDSPDTAIVVVEGLIPPGALEDARFDVRVFSHPSSSTTSLEGGRLWTTELVPAVRPDRGRRLLPPTGSRQPAPLASASGPVFINPFSEPGSVDRDDIDRRNGLIMNGGRVSEDMPLRLRLVQPSHATASNIQAALNTRYVQEPGQRGPTAHGENDESVAVQVPPSWRDHTEEFVDLVRHTTVYQGGPETVAARISRYVTENPAAAQAASWRWQALGPRSLEIVRQLYDYPQDLPRLAALRAGAGLDDALVTERLIEMTRSDWVDGRREAIQLLAEMGTDPRIDRALRGLLDDPDLVTRLEAYEALAQRHDPYVDRWSVDGKFVIDAVESSSPRVYITQVGLPRIAVFGRDLEVKRPATVAMWSGRLMIKADLDSPEIDLYYRPIGAASGATYRVSPRITELARFLGRGTDPENPLPGLGFSYSQVVGALHQIWRQKYVEADFRPEQDRILAAIIQQQSRGLVTDRPEFDTDVGTAGDALEAPDAFEQPPLPDAADDPGPRGTRPR